MHAKYIYMQFVALLSALLVCAACRSTKIDKKRIEKQQTRTQPMQERRQELMRQIHVRIEGVECTSCVNEMLTYLNNIPHVEHATFVGHHDACQDGYFTFYFPLIEAFDFAAHNVRLQADGMVMHLLN